MLYILCTKFPPQIAFNFFKFQIHKIRVFVDQIYKKVCLLFNTYLCILTLKKIIPNITITSGLYLTRYHRDKSTLKSTCYTLHIRNQYLPRYLL